MVKLDEKNCKILDLLQENCRMTLTEISKNVGLSVDSVKKRIDHLLKENVFYPKIQLRSRQLGYKDVVDIRIKLRNYNKQDLKNFVDYLISMPNVIEIIKLSGEWDMAIVIISKNSEELDYLSDHIRNKYSKIIYTWSGSLTIKVYKFEEFDMLGLMKYKNNKKEIKN